MKIHFELNTIRSGINKISRWNIIVSNPVNKFSSYFVYNNEYACGIAYEKGKHWETEEDCEGHSCCDEYVRWGLEDADAC